MSRARRTMPRSLRSFLLMGAGLVAALSLSQCRLVEDTVTGPEGGFLASRSDRSRNCISECARKYGREMQAEADLHVANVQACAGDLDCLDTESARHQAAVASVIEGRKKCFDDCHHQGGGTGGR